MGKGHKHGRINFESVKIKREAIRIKADRDQVVVVLGLVANCFRRGVQMSNGP